jgi:hypothetical protein
MKWLWLIFAIVVMFVTAPLMAFPVMYFDITTNDRRVFRHKVETCWLTRYPIMVHRKACEAFGRTQRWT